MEENTYSACWLIPEVIMESYQEASNFGFNSRDSGVHWYCNEISMKQINPRTVILPQLLIQQQDMSHVPWLTAAMQFIGYMVPSGCHPWKDCNRAWLRHFHSTPPSISFLLAHAKIAGCGGQGESLLKRFSACQPHSFQEVAAAFYCNFCALTIFVRMWI